MRTQMAMLIVLGMGWICGRVAADSEIRATIPLWDEIVPSAMGDAQKDRPSLIAFVPSEQGATGTAVIVCPGGGYGRLAMDHEGVQIAEWLNSIGITAFVLKYRLPADGYRHPIPLMDAQRAVRLVRSRADDWNIQPDRIGVLGFSAGGHLASTVATQFDSPVETGLNFDAVDTLSARPDFQILIYPVISMDGAITHHGSRNNLIGADPSERLVRTLSGELQVTSATPPAFLVHADDDKAVVPEHSIRYYLALRNADVSSELHIYRTGGHGFGMRPATGPAATWPQRCREWLEQSGLSATSKP